MDSASNPSETTTGQESARPYPGRAGRRATTYGGDRASGWTSGGTRCSSQCARSWPDGRYGCGVCRCARDPDRCTASSDNTGPFFFNISFALHIYKTVLILATVLFMANCRCGFSLDRWKESEMCCSTFTLRACRALAHARGGRALLRGRQLSSRDCGVPKRGEPVRLAANQRAPSRNCTTADAHG